LLAIKGMAGGQATIGALAQRLVVKHHTAVGLVNRLALAGLTLRTPHHGDGRQVVVEVTPRGERILRKLSLAHGAELTTAGPALAAALSAILAGAGEARGRQRRA